MKHPIMTVTKETDVHLIEESFLPEDAYVAKGEIVVVDRDKPAIAPEKVSVWPQMAEALEIIDQRTYDYAVDFLKRDKALQDAAEEHHRPMIDAAHKTHKATLAGLKTILEPLVDAETITKRKIAKWVDAQRAIAEASAKQAQAEAETRAAENLELEIESLEAQGAPAEEIKTIIREANATAVIVPATAPTFATAKGTSTPERWTAEVTDMRRFQIAVAKTPQYASLLVVNQAALNKLASSLRLGLVIDGVKVNRETSVSIRRK